MEAQQYETWAISGGGGVIGKPALANWLEWHHEPLLEDAISTCTVDNIT